VINLLFMMLTEILSLEFFKIFIKKKMCVCGLFFWKSRIFFKSTKVQNFGGDVFNFVLLEKINL